MKGKDIINAINKFIDDTGSDINKIIYDGDVFGNYDIILYYKRISLNLNCDRGYLSIFISDIRKKGAILDYSKILNKIPDIQYNNCNAFSDHEQLKEVLSIISKTIDLVEDYYIQRIKKKGN